MEPTTSFTEDERYRLLVEAVTDYAVYMLDPTGIVSSWNPGAERIKGYLPNEIIGQHFSRFYTEEDRYAAVGLAAKWVTLNIRRSRGTGSANRKPCPNLMPRERTRLR
jgi:PAS domain S-box-containing protein